MNYSRKEHSTVLLQNSVYVLGGYDGKTNSFLSSCERYSIGNDEWEVIKPMIIPKCAFAATNVGNKYIYILGGYDGSERLNTIERYDSKENNWILLDIQLK